MAANPMAFTLATVAPDHSVWWWILGISAIIGVIWWWSAAAGSRMRVGTPTAGERPRSRDGDPSGAAPAGTAGANGEKGDGEDKGG